jgi:hypothetical protein
MGPNARLLRKQGPTVREGPRARRGQALQSSHTLPVNQDGPARREYSAPVALTYADAVATLYQSSQEAFVTERKRLAAELKTGGDKTGAAQLSKLGRPSLSAWAVNQLWWRARPLFEELLGSSARLRRGDRSASGTHRDALAALRTRAAALLSEGGHAATDATLRRVTTTLAALAAAGGFEPEPPGALSADRDPPGFETLAGFEAGAAGERPAGAGAAGERAAGAEAGAAAAAQAAEQVRRERQARTEAERQAEARREREERARRQAEQEEQERRAAERKELRVALPAARAQLARDTAAVERLRTELGLAEQSAERARSALAELEQRQARLDQNDAG